nr:nitrate- and nitrite sensing domain-containing protein [Streptantibioticus silvisoli]
MALLLVPLVSLFAIWAFAALITGDGVFGLVNVKHVSARVGLPAQDTVDALSAERRAVLVHLAEPTDATAEADLRRAEASTDKRIAAESAADTDSTVRGDLDPASRTRLDALVKQAGGLSDLRRQVGEGELTGARAYTAYNALIDPYYCFFLGLDPVQSVGLDRQSRILVEMTRAREAISREDALFASAQAAGGMTRAEQREFADAVSQQRTAYATYPPLLPAPDSTGVADFWRDNTDARALHRDEERILDAAPQDAVRQVSASDWQHTTAAVIDATGRLDHQAMDAYLNRVRPYALDVLIKAAVAGGFGLLAVLLSVAVSLRVGRGLVRDLSALRKEAQEASGTRLPRVMRRLAAGEDVDIDAEVPATQYADDEIGAVGKALDTLQRAAVEAAVRQADMRRGVSDVFVNLARRNQVLLHRQLMLLDAMERRTEAADELADLFRLDHMTTRMRRHAEGLVILSGAAPSRQWRRPVRLIDVVRAAVAEVEDYERVEVRRLPRLAVAGNAVADVTHLLAELIENGTVFSPPHSTVQVHGERVANGYLLEIDDRGLGMPPETLLDANLRLAETPEFELSDTDRLGLFVVSRLAQRTGVRVSVRPSPYGGTTAVVLLPNALLTDTTGEEDADSGEYLVPGASGTTGAGGKGGPGGTGGPGIPRAVPTPLPDEITVPVDQDTAHQAFRDWGIVPSAAAAEDFVADARRRRARPLRQFDLPERSQHQQAPELPEPARPTASGHTETGPGGTDENAPLPRRRRAASPVIGAAPGAHRAPDRPAPDVPRGRQSPDPAARPAPDAEQDAAAPRTSPGLPRRVRQASLAPQLRDTGAAYAAVREESPLDRDADEVRSRMASLQRGWQRGRAEADESMTGTAGSSHRTIRTEVPDTAAGRGVRATGTTSEGDGR